MRVCRTNIKDMEHRGELVLVLFAISLLAAPATSALSNTTQEPMVILELEIPDTARVVDWDDGTYVVGTSGGDLYVVNEAGDYTVTALGAGTINDVRIENGFIGVAAGVTVIELELEDLTPLELWRTTLSGWTKVVSVDLSEDGDYVCYLAQRDQWYTNAGEVGVLGGGGGGGSLISRLYTSGYRPTNFWIDATGDMEYIAASHPTYPPYYRVGVGLYHFDGSTLTLEWWRFGVPEYETTEVRISESKDYVAAATSSGTYMKLLRISDGALLWSHNTPGKEQFCVDGDDNLDYVIGGNQAWSSPYGWFILRNLGESGYEVLDEGTMNGPINDLDSNNDASMLAFGSDAGEFLLLMRSDDSIEVVFEEDIGRLIDAIEIGGHTLLVGGLRFINLYSLWIEVPVDIKPTSCPNPLNVGSNGVLPVAIVGTEDFDVTQVDPASVELEGVPPLRCSYEDVCTPYYPLMGKEGRFYCTQAGPDGCLDLTLKFDAQAIVAALGDVEDKDEIVLSLTGNLLAEHSGTPIVGEDVVIILKKGKE